jgi:acetyl esterase/lipase
MRLRVEYFVLLGIVTGCVATEPEEAAQGAAIQEQSIPVRSSFTLPEQLRGPGALLEEAGIEIVYGPNSVPPPEGISEAAKAMWASLPQVPFYPQDPDRTAALRSFVNLIDDATFEQLRTPYSMEDRVIDGVTTLWSTPPQLEHEDKVMIFIHGGGWTVNTRRAQLGLQTAVASSLGVRVISIEYPLSPENPYPAALDDIVAAYRGVISEYGAENAGLFGTSAGGGLTLATLLRLKADGVPLPAASAALSPGADMTVSGHMYRTVGLQDPVLPPYGTYAAVQGYVGDADPTDPLVSPVFGDYTDVTPLFLLAGTAELIGSDGIRVAARARGQGVDVTLLVSDGMWHVPIANGSGVPELQLAYDEMIKFFRRHMGI